MRELKAQGSGPRVFAVSLRDVPMHRSFLGVHRLYVYVYTYLYIYIYTRKATPGKKNIGS